MVSKLKNFTKAAEQLHISQPAITKAIQCLEQELNVRLFDRCQKHVVLTIEGQVFFSQAERILSSVKEAVTEMSEFQNAHRGVIKLGVPPMIGAYLFPNLMVHFKQMHPLVDFKVAEAGSLDTISKIEKGELDLAIAILPENKQSLKTFLIKREEYLLCTQPNNPLAQHQTISFNQLRNESFILLKPGNYQHHAVLQNCALCHYTPNVIIASDHFKTIKGLVANGLGISFLMRMVVQEDPSPSIVAVPLEEPIKCDIGLVWSEGRYLSQTCKAFIKFTKEYVNAEQNKRARSKNQLLGCVTPAVGVVCNS
jgi:DNA-binding transcriptional LysR family regulator